MDSFFSLNNSISSHLQDENSCQIVSSQNDCSQNDSEIIQDVNSSQILSSRNDCSQNDSEILQDVNSSQILSSQNDSVISDINSNSSENDSDTDSTLRYDDSFSNIDTSEMDEVQSLDSDRRTSVSSSICEQKKSGLNIYYTNADSIINKREELQAEINLKDPDFVVITEGYPKSISPNDIFQSEFEIKGFERLHGAENTLEGDVSDVIALNQLTSPFSPRKATKMSP